MYTVHVPTPWNALLIIHVQNIVLYTCIHVYMYMHVTMYMYMYTSDGVVMRVLMPP